VTQADASAEPRAIGPEPLEFRDITITTYTDLLGQPDGGRYHRGGPRWPDWDAQTAARHCTRGRPVDDEPPEQGPVRTIGEPIAWAGPIAQHFGHQIADFSMRLVSTTEVAPARRLLFCGQPRFVTSLADVRPFFWSVLEWFGIPAERVEFLTEPTLARDVVVLPQAEQIGGPGPTDAHLDAMDRLVQRQIGKPRRRGTVYVSRASMYGHFAGEAEIERALTASGIRVIRPETMPLVDQLRAYVSARHLVFAEGSAIHGLQLLGRSVNDVMVLVRRPGQEIARDSVQPRAHSLSYRDATKGVICTLWPTGALAHPWALSILDRDWFLEAMSGVAPRLERQLPRSVFERARDADIMDWFGKHPSPRESATEESLEHALNGLREANLEHLVDQAEEVLEARGVRSRPSPMAAVADRQRSESPAQQEMATGETLTQRRLYALSEGLDAATYLEIGVATGTTFLGIRVPNRTGVDPKFGFDTTPYADAHTTFVPTTSDEFFASLASDVKFDLMFIDGLHTFEQTYRDLCAALLHSHPRSVILLDDTVPIDVYSSIGDVAQSLRYREQAGISPRMWHGDVYKVVLAIHDFHLGLNYRTIVGPGNPQTLVWRTPNAIRTAHFGSIEEISRVTWFELMDNRQLLQECSEQEAIELCLRDLQGAAAGSSG
jgi:hypothetical protein